jgi:hypothetical protein
MFLVPLVDCSEVVENVTRDANLLAPHLLALRRLELLCEELAPELERLSSKEGKPQKSPNAYVLAILRPNNQSAQTVLQASSLEL